MANHGLKWIHLLPDSDFGGHSRSDMIHFRSESVHSTLNKFMQKHPLYDVCVQIALHDADVSCTYLWRKKGESYNNALSTVPAVKHDAENMLRRCFSFQGTEGTGYREPCYWERHPHNIIFPRPCLSVDAVLIGLWTSLFFLQYTHHTYVLYIHHAMGSCIHHVKGMLLLPGHREPHQDQDPENHEKGEIHPDP